MVCLFGRTHGEAVRRARHGVKTGREDMGKQISNGEMDTQNFIVKVKLTSVYISITKHCQCQGFFTIE